MIGDGAGFHHREGQDGVESFAANIHVLTLPPYSPELNPIEKLWDIVKDKALRDSSGFRREYNGSS